MKMYHGRMNGCADIAGGTAYSAGAVRLAISGILALLITAAAARAETVTLVCHLDSNADWAEDGPTIIKLDETNSSVEVQFAAEHMTDPQVSGGQMSTSALGPVQAKFGNDTITFSPVGSTLPGMYYSLDRTTAIFAQKNVPWTKTWTCSKAQKQF